MRGGRRAERRQEPGATAAAGDDLPVLTGGRSPLRRVARSSGGVLFGDQRRIGLWIFPLFLLVALLAAVLAGGLAVLYYGQQVDDLEDTTAAARAEVVRVRDEVVAAASEAQAQLDRSLAEARDALAQGQPIDSPAAAGVFAAGVDHAGGERRVASAFAVFSDADETFLATTYRLVATPGGGAVGRADVYLPSGPVSAEVVNVDAEHDLAALRIGVGQVPVLPWRPPAEALSRGDAVFLAAIAGVDAAAVVEGRLAAVSPAALVVSFPVNDFLSGGPLLDSAGAVVGVASTRYAPFGDVAGAASYAVPVRRLCAALVSCSPEDLAGAEAGPAEPVPAPIARPAPSVTPVTPPDGDGGEGGEGGQGTDAVDEGTVDDEVRAPAPAPPAPPPAPPPIPTPTAEATAPATTQPTAVPSAADAGSETPAP